MLFRLAIAFMLTFSAGCLQVNDLETSDHELRQLLFHELLHRGCYIAARGFIALSLDITDEQCDTLVGVMSEAIDSISPSN